MRKNLILTTLCVGVLTLTGCSLGASAPGGSGGSAEGSGTGTLDGATIAVGSKQFTEQLVLCEIAAQRLESQGATIKRNCGISGTASVRAAELSGDVGMYWEYTGTGWITNLKQTEVIADATQQYEKVRDMDLSQNQITWLPPAEANNTYAIAIKTETAKKLKVTTLSDYAALSMKDPKQASFCGAAEFFGRDDGWSGVTKAYGITVPQAEVATLEEGAIYNSISTGNPCNFGEVFATDGRIAALGLTVLKDDKNFFPFYNLSLTVRQDVLKKYPTIEDVMAPVTKLLTTGTMQKLNASVDVDGKTPKAVATAWFKETGLNK